jgi:hypothetical protein
MALSSIPFCPYDSLQAGLLYLPAPWRDTTVFSSKWQWSRKKAGVHGLYPSLVPGMDSLPCYAPSGGLTAILWVKPSLGVMPHSKERRRGAARLCLKNLCHIKHNLATEVKHIMAPQQ